MKFYFKATDYGQRIKVSTSKNSRKLVNKLALVNFENGQIKVYLRLTYGIGKDTRGKMVQFYNDGWYDDRHLLMEALTAFREVADDF